MKGFDLITPGWNRAQLEQETIRIYDICDGCRRCFNLCPSFNTLFDRIDEHESDLTKLQPHDYAQVEKECYYYKLCYNHCQNFSRVSWKVGWSKGPLFHPPKPKGAKMPFSTGKAAVPYGTRSVQVRT